MKTTKIRVGDLVKVNVDGGLVGQVREVAADGMVGVALMNERGRVDLWHPSQVERIAAGEMARVCARFLRIK